MVALPTGMMRLLALLATSLTLLGGCAESLAPFGRVPGGGKPKQLFWPPPPATAVWTGDLPGVERRSFDEVAVDLARALHDAGYRDAHWYPIGARYDHGFAVTTRVERLDEAGAPSAAGDRWSELHPEPVNLLWLEGARAPRLPAVGRYRALLIAFSDLLAEGLRVPTEGRDTLMESTDAPPRLPLGRRANTKYRLAYFVYEYQAERADTNGAAVRAR